MCDLGEDVVNSYLQNNPDFLTRWLSEHGTAEQLQAVASKLTEESNENVRPSLPNFTQVAKNSITGSIFKQYLEGSRARKTSIKKDRNSLQHMSEEDIFMELIRDISSELDVNVLCHKILQNVNILTNSDRGSLFLVRGSKDNRYLVSKLFDVTNTSTLEESIHTADNEIKVPFGKGIAGHVAQSKDTVNIRNAYEDPRFNQEVDKRTGYTTHSILCLPIINYEGEVIGVAQIINKIDGNHEFTRQDEELFRKYLTFCGIGITNAQLFEMSVTEFQRNQLLLHLARGIFEEQTNLQQLVKKIMVEAQDLLKCERCSVFLLEDTFENDIHKFTKRFVARLGQCSNKNLVMAMQDPSNMSTPSSTSGEHREARNLQEVSFSMAFYLNAKDRENVLEPSQKDLSKSKTAEIAKFVVMQGTAVNIPDLEIDGRFGKGPCMDPDGFHIRSVLCMPVFNSDKKIIGVTQLMNKLNSTPFDDNDEHIIEAFSIFTGLGIHNCQMYENACRLMAKQTVALEVLSYHATAQKEETEKLVECEIPTADDYRLYSFDFDDMVLSDDDTLRAVIRMFTDANIINSFKVPYDVICRWTASVKKNYRPVTYHNWRHAFNVCQTMFTMLFTGQLRPLFGDLEIYALMVACLCHDLDHRGTNNAFQVKVASPLAMLYSTSVLEHHHFDHCIMILNSEGNNIFQSLSPGDYRKAIKMLEHAILSTDLAIYFKKRGDFKSLIEGGEQTFDSKYKKDLLKAMMMTACDVAAIAKPWDIQQNVAQLVAGEFFEQGDIEKTKLGEQPIPMMDRDKKDELPKMQVGFIDAICMPVYKMFADKWTRLEPLLQGVQTNRDNWHQMSESEEADQSSASNTPKPETGSKTDSSKEILSSSPQPSPQPLSNDHVASKSRDTDSVTLASQKQNGASSHTAQSAHNGSQSPPVSSRSVNKAPQRKYQPTAPTPKAIKQDSVCDQDFSPKHCKSKKQKSGFCVMS
ncbi:cGMP-specific 3',5'-cyclic phosphodiesterase-like isoform X2 [Haliotis rufescens]|uniref:cGMP-specific 3',5'-cyclic phosphodiesterase-like isoform X2 n=1 Tax=Haliotis rufescens TaxID=6454 RepID=UPI001EAF8E13|nr:cGMP-specific 3',5'-cyclic phosphodiesterase-like isoform X2 [Haliotis rufescens]